MTYYNKLRSSSKLLLPRVYNRIGMILHDQKKYDSALVYYQKAIDQNSQHYHALRNKGLVFTEIGEQDSAIIYFQKCVEAKVDFGKGYHCLGFWNLDYGDPKKAKYYLDKSLKLEPEYLYTHWTLGRYFNHIGQYETALLHFFEALKKKPNEPSLLNAIGNSYFAINNKDSAEVYYRRSLKNDSIYHFANRNLALTIRDSDIDSAIYYLEKAIASKPEYLNAHLLLADILYKKSLYNRALEYYVQAYEIDHLEYYSNIGIAKTQIRLGKAQIARKYLLNASRLNPRIYDHWVEFACVMKQLGKVDSVRHYERKAIQKGWKKSADYCQK